MTVAVRLAGPADRDAVARLIEAMDRHYESPMPGAGEIGPAVETWLSGEGTDGRIALAFDGAPSADNAVGIAIFAVLHPGVALTGLLFLKDVFVAETARGLGAGEAIMRLCVDAGGSVTGEHGIGLEKRDFMPWIFSDADLATMAKLLHERGSGRGLISVCTAGGMGVTAIVEAG